MDLPLVNTLRLGAVAVAIRRGEAAEVDELGSSVGKKQEPPWLWQALDHGTGKILAYGFGHRHDEGCL